VQSLPPPPPPAFIESEPQVGSSGGAEGPPARTATASPIEIVRYIGVDRSKWPGGGAPSNLTDLYTRIEVETDRTTAGGGVAGEPENPRAYEKERRSALARLLANKTITITTLARADLNDPDLSITLPLYSISHSSIRGTGEVFVTDFMSSHVQAPLFRIRPNTAITLHLNTKISDDLKVQGASTVLKAVQTAVNIAAPTSTLFTTLSKSDLSNASKAIDSALGGLFSQDLTEDVELGRLADSWSPAAEVEVDGRVPPGLVRTEQETRADKDIGVWHIRLSCPRPSYFDPRDLCAYEPDGTRFLPGRLGELQDDIARRVSDSSILEEQLSAQITIQSFIQTQSWYTAFLGNGAKTPADARAFCTDALSALYAAGLNRFDASLALRAMADQMPGIATLKPDVALTNANCGFLVDKAVRLAG
jgi:hypothetical protein